MASSMIEMPETLITELRLAAEALRRSPEDLAREAVEHFLKRRRREALYAYGEKQAQKLGIKEEDVPQLVEQSRL